MVSLIVTAALVLLGLAEGVSGATKARCDDLIPGETCRLRCYSNTNQEPSFLSLRTGEDPIYLQRTEYNVIFSNITITDVKIISSKRDVNYACGIKPIQNHLEIERLRQNEPEAALVWKIVTVVVVIVIFVLLVVLVISVFVWHVHRLLQ